MNTLESKNINLLIDFDSTIIKDESLELLAEISVQNPEDKIKIASITNDAMNGKIGFSEALEKRVSLLKSKKEQLKDIIQYNSFVNNTKCNNFERTLYLAPILSNSSEISFLLYFGPK